MNLFQVTKKQPSGGLELKTFTGNPVTFTPTYSEALPAPFNGINLKAEIVATQAAGTPTPSNPLPISGISSLDIVRCGINMWNEETQQGYYDYSTGARVPVTTELCSLHFIPVIPQTTYYFFKGTGTSVGDVLYYDRNKTYLNQRKGLAANAEFTTPSNCYFIQINLGNDYGTTYNDNISINSDKSTSYHAYNGQTFTIDLGGTRYGGVYTADGKLTLTHVKIDLGSLIYGADTNRPGVFYAGISDVVSRTECLSETYNCIMRGVPAAADLSNYDNSISTWDSYGRGIYIIDTAQAATSASDFKTLVTGVDFVYELATPIEIDVSSISVVAVSGVNNITSNGNGDVTAQYKVSIQKYIDDHV